MLDSINILTTFAGISTALCWGAADFIGGVTSRRVGAYWMTLGTIGCGMLLLLPLVLACDESVPSVPDWLWCMLAGGFGATGILLLYRSMTLGRMSLAAPVAALTSAALPVVAGMMSEGLPETQVLAGVGLALVAVWLIAKKPEVDRDDGFILADLRFPFFAGSCMGVFLILMHAGSSEAVIWPMVAVRCGGVAILLLFWLVTRPQPLPSGKGLPLWCLFLLNALLDVAGSGLFIFAGQVGRLDVAAVLSSFFPGMTVFLAWLLLGETLSRVQLTGIILAIGATALLAR